MRNIYKKIKLSPFFILLILLSLISGLFRDISCLFMIIIIHELGHVFTSLIFNWNIKSVSITACGGYITYDENIDKPFKEELLIALSGLFMQTLFYFFCFILNRTSIIDLDTLLLIKKYHYSILIFNIVPVVPLDGSKILNIILNMCFSYRKALKITNLVSIAMIFIAFLMFINLNFEIEYGYLVIASFVISKVFNSIKDVPFLFNRFLFERYKDPISVNKYFYIKNGDIKKFRRQRKNYFYIDGRYYNEKAILKKKFNHL